MKKISFRILSVLLALLMLISIVACNQESSAQPTPTPTPEPSPDKPEPTTKFYMPAGWSSKVETPIIWTSKDEGTVTVPDAVLQGDFGIRGVHRMEIHLDEVLVAGVER